MRWRGVLALLAALTGCVAPPGVSYAPRDFTALPGWDGDSLQDAGDALAHGCAVRAAHPAWREACRTRPSDPAQLRPWLMENFQPWQIMDGGRDEGLFTGYYEAVLHGSLTRRNTAQTPVYGPPRDLVSADLGQFKTELTGQKLTGRVEAGHFVPYPDRAQLAAQPPDAPVLLWADDPVDLFFMQVQGSGRALLDDGTEWRLGYAGQNGRPYVALGREMKKRGLLPQDSKVTMEVLRTWLHSHPLERAAALNLNPSYVFFKPGDARGPVGAAGTVLTPLRSMAVDRAAVPLGSFLWLDCTRPDGRERLQRLAVAEDTGGAIKGGVRGDLFWGYGAEAEAQAGQMQSTGRWYLLWPKNAPPPGGRS